ncbi:MAG: hypothetical protein HY782_13255 [Chloroflexi bacterium]|nr:hypothetical protein [Chloroflexota bacterium]
METVTLPASLVEKMLQAGESFAEFSDELEDFLLSQDSKFIAKMRAARADHLEGKTKPLSALEREISRPSKPRKHSTRGRR